MESICEKHPEKRAKYTIMNQEKRSLCSKCALHAALSGITIKEKKERMLENLVAEIKDLESHIARRVSAVPKKEQELRDHYQHQIDQVQRFYEQVPRGALTTSARAQGHPGEDPPPRQPPESPL